MPTRRLIFTIPQRRISLSVAHCSPTLPKWRPSLPVPHVGKTKAFRTDVAPFTTQQQYRERLLDFDQEDDEEHPLPQREASITDSLHQRLRFPKRSKGHEGNNDTRKGHKNEIITSQLSKGSSDNGVNPKSPKARPNWKSKETKELENHLQRVARNFPSVSLVHNILRVLTAHRSVKPTVSHYEALILSNCDAELGSTKAVKAILQEMEREHIAMGTSIYEAVLKVLAVHPDYLLRLSILDSMAKQWMSLTPSIEHFIAAGHIREGQLELALQCMEKMQQQNNPPEQWIYGLMIYSLCEAEDFDAVLKLLYHTEDERVDISTNTLYHILDKASECLHLDLTKRIWHDMVEPTYINPATGICFNVLLTAARSGDKALAASVSKVLAHRQSEPSDLEYNLLEETYVKAGDESGAKEIRIRRDKLDPTAAKMKVQREQSTKT